MDAWCKRRFVLFFPTSERKTPGINVHIVVCPCDVCNAREFAANLVGQLSSCASRPKAVHTCSISTTSPSRAACPVCKDYCKGGECACRTLPKKKLTGKAEDLPDWNYDGSSTDQAPGDDSEACCFVKPVSPDTLHPAHRLCTHVAVCCMPACNGGAAGVAPCARRDRVRCA